MINPFGDSSSTSEDSNPFYDESVTRVFESINDQSLTVEQKQNENTLNNNRAESTKVQKDKDYQPPEYMKGGNDLIDNKTMDERELLIKKREHELIRKEQEFEIKSKKSGIDLSRPPNWPKCRPMLYHDISKDIPQICRPFVRKAYYCWMLAVAGILWNAVCLISKIFVKDAEDKGNDLVFSCIYPFFVIPLSWIFWYRLLYNATRRGKSSKFVIFFSTYSMWFLFSVFVLIGANGTGAAGLINTIDTFGLNKTVGICMVVNILVWLLETISIVVIIRQVNMYYKFSGMTTGQAKRELGTEVGKTLASGMV
ncbi:secretory carrier-associated membrane protein [Anaeramoeba flamelloides]|uniref:Secretory carrier-associated membrane protein n=1 Tax=Anaeramoeba flamelloides TaxID=1746091 RepID=A0ABQ8YJF2_9EUKA|nr:secretory carrier-associated membrane protein [Anaeramoeba flamelloides]